MSANKMESWLLYSLIAAFAFGIYNFFLKISVDNRFGALSPTTSVLGISLAIFVSTLVYGVYTNTLRLPSKSGTTMTMMALLLLIGILWTVGTLSSAIALKTGNASQIVPIFNANTLVTVLLALIFFGEATSLGYVIKIAAGTALIIAGVFILS